MTVFCPGEPHGHSLDGVLSGTTHSQEARVEIACLAYSCRPQHVTWHLKNLFFYFFKDGVLSVSIWSRAMVLHGPFMSPQSSEGY